MKLGIANRITVTDVDLSDTVDVCPRYAEVVMLVDAGHGVVAQAWLDALSEENS